MPINSATMTAEMLKLTDQTNGGFVGFPPDIQTTADNWAAAVEAFFLELAVPAVVPGTQAAGRSAFSSTMAGLLSVPGGGLAALDAGFVAFAGVIVGGIIPASGVATPPPAGPNIGLILASFVAVPTGDPNPPAAAMGSGILAWAKTGMFTPAAPPGAPPVPWS